MYNSLKYVCTISPVRNACDMLLDNWQNLRNAIMTKLMKQNQTYFVICEKIICSQHDNLVLVVGRWTVTAVLFPFSTYTLFKLHCTYVRSIVSHRHYAK